MFSKTCEYGIRAVIYITVESNKGLYTGIDDIVKAIDAPKPFTAKILQNLTRMRIIDSQKGPNGGFYLNTKKNVWLIDIVNAIDGDRIFNGCGLGLPKCSATKPCPLHLHFKKIRTDLKMMLENTTMQELARAFDKNVAFLKK